MAEMEVRLPNLGEDAGDEAKVAFWYVDVGEQVEEGDDLVQMLTDKATFDVPSPVAGRLLSQAAEEVSAVMRDLRAAGCDILTIGQYLAPSASHAPVVRFAEPAEFAAWEAEARALGFAAVAAGPFVRSSYQAENVFLNRNP